MSDENEKKVPTVQDVVDFGFENAYDREAPNNKVRLALEGARIIFAKYMCESYEGNCYVLYAKGGKLFLVVSSHCSCNGLDWEPQEVSVVEAIESVSYNIEREEVADALAAAGF
jgi:hypothetical protein